MLALIENNYRFFLGNKVHTMTCILIHLQLQPLQGLSLQAVSYIAYAC